MKFHQSCWMAKYIDFNTEQRKRAKTTFEKDFFKLLNNSVFGKTMENLRLHNDVRIVSDVIRAERYSSAPNFDSFRIINEDVCMLKMSKKHIKWTKPTYLGFAILELSKLLMYRFHYEKILPRYGSNCKLLFTDTDSLTYELTTKDMYADMLQDIDLYDTSGYPSDHPLYSTKHMKTVGKMKDELNGIPMISFVGLRSKMYAILLPDNKDENTAKGVNRQYAKKI